MSNTQNNRWTREINDFKMIKNIIIKYIDIKNLYIKSPETLKEIKIHDYLPDTGTFLISLKNNVNAEKLVIYSVIAEEKGFFGSVIVLSFFGLIIVLSSRAALMARDKMGRVLCSGIVAMVFCHVFINIAMTVGLMPIVGLPLPLLSYGGSFMVVMMSALGIIQSVFIRSRRVESF